MSSCVHHKLIENLKFVRLLNHSASPLIFTILKLFPNTESIHPAAICCTTLRCNMRYSIRFARWRNIVTRMLSARLVVYYLSTGYLHDVLFRVLCFCCRSFWDIRFQNLSCGVKRGYRCPTLAYCVRFVHELAPVLFYRFA